MTSERTADVLCWARTETDGRDTGSAVERITVPHQHAYRIGKILLARGEYGLNESDRALIVSRLNAGRVVPGFSVHVKYDNGRTRRVRE